MSAGPSHAGSTEADVRWLDDDEQAAWRGLLTMHAHLTAAMNRDLQRSAGLSLADYDVLVRLSETPDGRCRIFELGQALGWEKSRLSKQLGRMETRDLVVREDCQEDRRGNFAVLTDSGRGALVRAAPAHVAFVRRVVFDQLSAPQLAALRRLTTVVLDALDGTGPEGPSAR